MFMNNKHLLVAMISAMFVQVVRSDEMAEMTKMLHDTCAGQTGVNEDLITAANKGNIANDSTLKCYMKCIYEELGILQGGVLDIETALAILPEDVKPNLEPIIRSCGTKKGADDCETAYNTNICYYETNPKLYFLV